MYASMHVCMHVRMSICITIVIAFLKESLATNLGAIDKYTLFTFSMNSGATFISSPALIVSLIVSKCAFSFFRNDIMSVIMFLRTDRLFNSFRACNTTGLSCISSDSDCKTYFCNEVTSISVRHFLIFFSTSFYGL